MNSFYVVEGISPRSQHIGDTVLEMSVPYRQMPADTVVITNNTDTDSEQDTHASNERDNESLSSTNDVVTIASSSKLSCAFTIDNFNGMEGDAVTKAAKYRNMLERFQNRHRVSARIPKNDDGNITTSPKSPSASAPAPASDKSSTQPSLTSNENVTHNDHHTHNAQKSSSAQKVQIKQLNKSPATHFAVHSFVRLLYGKFTH